MAPDGIGRSLATPRPAPVRAAASLHRLDVDVASLILDRLDAPRDVARAAAAHPSLREAAARSRHAPAMGRAVFAQALLRLARAHGGESRETTAVHGLVARDASLAGLVSARLPRPAHGGAVPAPEARGGRSAASLSEDDRALFDEAVASRELDEAASERLTRRLVERSTAPEGFFRRCPDPVGRLAGAFDRLPEPARRAVLEALRRMPQNDERRYRASKALLPYALRASEAEQADIARAVQVGPYGFGSMTLSEGFGALSAYAAASHGMHPAARRALMDRALFHRVSRDGYEAFYAASVGSWDVLREDERETLLRRASLARLSDPSPLDGRDAYCAAPLSYARVPPQQARALIDSVVDADAGRLAPFLRRQALERIGRASATLDEAGAAHLLARAEGLPEAERLAIEGGMIGVASRLSKPSRKRLAERLLGLDDGVCLRLLAAACASSDPFGVALQNHVVARKWGSQAATLSALVLLADLGRRLDPRLLPYVARALGALRDAHGAEGSLASLAEAVPAADAAAQATYLRALVREGGVAMDAALPKLMESFDATADPAARVRLLRSIEAAAVGDADR